MRLVNYDLTLLYTLTAWGANFAGKTNLLPSCKTSPALGGQEYAKVFE